jgi:hypothetical protein
MRESGIELQAPSHLPSGVRWMHGSIIPFLGPTDTPRSSAAIQNNADSVLAFVAHRLKSKRGHERETG